MTFTLPPPLAAMVTAHNAHDITAFTACFTEDAVVRDEGCIYVGPPAIRDWFAGVSRQYCMTIQVTDLTTQDGEPVLHGKVSGAFDSSPINMRYYLALEDGKIVALKIVA
ncbi:MAG: nuclear transport factor 2 family protein [Nibricoccus sp.]